MIPRIRWTSRSARAEHELEVPELLGSFPSKDHAAICHRLWDFFARSTVADGTQGQRSSLRICEPDRFGGRRSTESFPRTLAADLTARFEGTEFHFGRERLLSSTRRRLSTHATRPRPIRFHSLRARLSSPRFEIVWNALARPEVHLVRRLPTKGRMRKLGVVLTNVERLSVAAARYEADRALEQFDLCDPKNRLVADTLEERLNDKPVELRDAKLKLEVAAETNDALTDEQRRRLEELGRGFPSAWNHTLADPKLKKRIIRTAIREVLVKHEVEEQRLEVTIHWMGGAHSRIHVAKRATPVGSKTDPSLAELVRTLATELSDAEIARILNMKKLATPRGLRWTQDRVESFRKRQRIRARPRERDPDVLNMNEAIKYLGIGHNGLLGLVKRGAISPNQLSEFAPWRVSRTELDSDRVQSLLRVLKKTGRLPRGGSPKGQLTFFDDEI